MKDTGGLGDCPAGAREQGRRVVEVAGTIHEMGRDEHGEAYLSFAVIDEFVTVGTQFGRAERDSLQALRRGQRMSIRCMVTYDSTNRRSELLLTRCGLAP